MSTDVGQRLLEDDLVFVDDELVERFSRSVATRGDLIFTCWGTINQVGLVDGRSKHEKYLVSNKQMKLTPDTTVVLPLFLYYFFSSPAGQSQIAMNAHGSSVPGFNLSKLKGIQVPTPPLAEQEYIVDLLGSLDDKIELNRRMNETLEAMAQAIFRDWFVDFGPTRRKLEGATDPVTIMGGLVTDPTRARELADLFPATLGDDGLPEGWTRCTLGTRVDIRRGGSPRPIHDFIRSTGIPWVKISDATRCSGPNLFDTKEFIREEGLSKTVALNSGSLILSNSATPGLPRFLQLSACIHDGWLYFPRMDGISKELLYLVFCHYRGDIINKATGTVFNNLKTDTLKQFEILNFSQDASSAFDAVVKPIFDLILSNEIQSRALSNIRDLILPKLMSGEIRFGEAEELVEAAQ